jgi:hypothetical protein
MFLCGTGPHDALPRCKWGFHMHMTCVKWLAVPAGMFGLFLLWLPISLQAQLILSFAVLGVMFLAMTRPANTILRLVTFTFAGILAMRYAFWRTTETLPSIYEPLNFIPGLILYLAEMYCLAMLAISFFMLADPLKRKAPDPGDAASLPTVDVFIPSYNEEPELLAGTLAAAKSLLYPKDKLNVYLLDDGGTEAKRNHKDPRIAIAAIRRHEQLKALCASLGVHYHARKQNDHAKAGNLNEGLKVSNGELVVVFDADHAPVREFLRETVGFFREDKKLFLVQTPHYFLNPDPLEKNLQTFARMPSENEMFYSILQRGLDKWNASFFCGSAAVLRRSALASANGFLRPVDHRGLRDGAGAAFQGLAQPLCRQAADCRPPAGDLRVLHRPARPLVPGHAADPHPQPAVPRQGPDPRPAHLLCRHQPVLAVPAVAACLRLFAAALHLLLAGNLPGEHSRIRLLCGDLSHRLLRHAELPLRSRALALGLRAL